MIAAATASPSPVETTSISLIEPAGNGIASRVFQSTPWVVAEAEQAGLAVLAGRAVRSTAPMPMRPLAEALLAWLRTGSVPDDSRLSPYLPALGRLAPQLGSAPDDGGSSVMLVGEALLRL